MKLFTNISELRTVSDAGTIKDAALVEDGGVIVWVGPAREVPADYAAAEHIDCGNRAVLPGWVDSHTHMIFDGNRAEEFEARMAGLRLRRRWHCRHDGSHAFRRRAAPRATSG